MAIRDATKDKSNDITDYFNVSDHELESTLEQYLEESDEKPRNRQVNFITATGLVILAITMLMVMQIFLPFNFDFEPLLTAINIFGGLMVAFVGLGIFGNEGKKKKKKRVKDFKFEESSIFGSKSIDKYALSRKKRLFKSRSNKKIFGVCGGLAEYFGIDATLVRILFIIFVFLGYGSSLVLYFLMGLILPVKPRVSDVDSSENIKSN